jgi:hypothetical protein
LPSRLLSIHAKYYTRELRIKAYAQLLESYRSVTDIPLPQCQLTGNPGHPREREREKKPRRRLTHRAVEEHHLLPSRLLSIHAKYYTRELRIKAYAQLLDRGL